MDDTFVRAPRWDVRGRTGTSWASWLPELALTVDEDRGEKGVRWRAGAAGGALAGSAEVWLEAVPGGTVAHLYVRLDPSAASGPFSRSGRTGPLAPSGQRRARRLPDRLRRSWKRGLHAFKDSLEGERSR